MRPSTLLTMSYSESQTENALKTWGVMQAECSIWYTTHGTLLERTTRVVPGLHIVHQHVMPAAGSYAIKTGTALTTPGKTKFIKSY